MGDPSKRAFTYFVLTGGRFIYASALRLAVLKFILSMTVSTICFCFCNLDLDRMVRQDVCHYNWVTLCFHSRLRTIR